MSDNARQSNPFSSPRETRIPKRSVLQLTMVMWLIGIFLAEAVASGITLPTVIQRFQSLSLLFSSPPPQPKILGHAYFVSSGFVSPDSTEGITDELQINLENVPVPQLGKSYNAWLLNDKNLNWKPIYLSQLAFNNNTLSLFYPGDAVHSNLLASNSRFLVTQDDATIIPISPSHNPGTWVYYAEFSQIQSVPTDPKSYSLYDHIRHLLADDPKVKAAGLTGGLDIWLFRNTQEILAWVGSARDAWKYKSVDFIHRQLIRIMDYLDGTVYVNKDIPGQSILADPTISKVGLLTFDPVNQDPPGYLYHIGKHLHELTTLTQTPPAQKTLAIQIIQEIDGVNLWLGAIRDDILKLYAMDDAHLTGIDGLTLLDEVATLANDAFVGKVDTNAQVTDGVVQIHYAIQRLATFDIRACTASDPCSIR